MNGGMYYEVLTIGDFCLGRRTIQVKTVKPITTGCFWFKDCEHCRWDDSVMSDKSTYDSNAGRRLRAESFASILNNGVALSLVALFFGLTELEVKQQVATVQAPTVEVIAAPRNKRKETAIRMRQEGQSEQSVALDLGVTPRTVRYWCQGVSGIDRPHWDRETIVEDAVAVVDPALVHRCELIYTTVR